MSTLSIEGLSQVDRLGPDVLSNRLETRAAQSLAEAQGTESSLPLTVPHGTFAEMLESSVSKVNDMQLSADQSVKDLVAGRTKNIHETMLALEQADLSLKLMMQVRNKVVDAYREIMRMQV